MWVSLRYISYVGKKEICGIVGLCVGFGSQLAICERVEEFSLAVCVVSLVMRRPSKSPARVSLGYMPL